MKLFKLLLHFALISSSTVIYSQENMLQKSIEKGQEIYTDFCMNCHMVNGEGVKNTFPPLAKSDYLKNNQEASIRGIKYGQKGEITVNGIKYNGNMTPMGLDDKEIADVMNFINNSWGNLSETIVTKEDVAAIKKD